MLGPRLLAGLVTLVTLAACSGERGRPTKPDVMTMLVRDRSGFEELRDLCLEGKQAGDRGRQLMQQLGVIRAQAISTGAHCPKGVAYLLWKASMWHTASVLWIPEEGEWMTKNGNHSVRDTYERLDDGWWFVMGH